MTLSSKVEVIYANNGERLSEDANSVINEYKNDGYELVHVTHNVIESISEPTVEGMAVVHKHFMTLVFEQSEGL